MVIKSNCQKLTRMCLWKTFKNKLKNDNENKFNNGN